MKYLVKQLVNKSLEGCISDNNIFIKLFRWLNILADTFWQIIELVKDLNVYWQDMNSK